MSRSVSLQGTVFVIASLVALAAPTGCLSSRDADGEFTYREWPVINLPEGAFRLMPSPAALDSPMLSPDGNRLAVQLEIYEDPALPYEIYSLAVAERDVTGRWGDLDVIQRGVYKKYAGRMEMPIQPAFDECGRRLFVTQILFNSLLSIPFPATLRSWIERIPWRGGNSERVVEGRDWNLRANELIQHARVSPDGRWLSFYTRVHQQDQGVYLLDLRSGAHFRLSREHDKHPTWSPDGKRIYFHTAVGGKRHRFDFFARGVERAVIGFLEMRFEKGQFVGCDRVLMDKLGGDFIYHKHPTIVAGTGLLFFHGRLEPSGQMKFMVRQPRTAGATRIAPSTLGGPGRAIRVMIAAPPMLSPSR